MLTKAIQERSYRVLQVTPKWKALKQYVYFLRDVEFRPTFAGHLFSEWLSKNISSSLLLL